MAIPSSQHIRFPHLSDHSVASPALGNGPGSQLRLRPGLTAACSRWAPSENMYASDLHSKLWEIGCDLFRDRDAMKARFVQADIFEPDSPLRDLDGKIDIIIACQFLHLFSWKQ